MKESRKVVMEEGFQDAYKRIIMEQGYEADKESQTPKWDTMKVNLKEGTAEKGALFVNSFTNGLVPAMIIIIATMIIVAIVCC